MAISNVWHFVEDGKRAGPYTEEEMRGFVRQGRVRSETLVWCDGMTDWMPLHLSKGAALLLAAEGAVRAGTPPVPGRSYGQSYETPARGAFGEVAMADGRGGPGKPMGLFEAASSCFSKYAQFSGRASRSEFWFFGLFFFLFMICAGIVTNLVGDRSGVIIILGVVAFILPNLAVTVRRLHDIDFSGWWLLIGIIPGGSIVLLVFYCLRPTPGRNRFG